MRNRELNKTKGIKGNTEVRESRRGGIEPTRPGTSEALI